MYYNKNYPIIKRILCHFKYPTKNKFNIIVILFNLIIIYMLIIHIINIY